MKKIKFLLMIVFVAFFSHSYSFAQQNTAYGTPTWGLEFTFTNPVLITEGNKSIDTIDSDANSKARDIWADLIKKICRERPSSDPEKCRVRKMVGKYDSITYRVTYPNDSFYYDVTVDPLVIEINASPLTIKRAKDLEERIQRDIFDMAKQVKNASASDKVNGEYRIDIGDNGLTPHKRIGNGDLHIGLRSFQKVKEKSRRNGRNGRVTKTQVYTDDTLLFERFVADHWNYPTLSVGGLGLLPTNAPPMGFLEADQRLKAQSILGATKASDSIEDLAYKLNDEVYTKTWSTIPAFADHPSKYQTLNFTRIYDNDFTAAQKTLEIRGIRPQRSAEDFIKMLELFEARLEMLKNKRGVLAYKNNALGGGQRVSDPQRVLNEFYDFVTGAGLNWDDYKDLLSEEFHDEIRMRRLFWDGVSTLSHKRPADSDSDDYRNGQDRSRPCTRPGHW